MPEEQNIKLAREIVESIMKVVNTGGEEEIENRTLAVHSLFAKIPESLRDLRQIISQLLEFVSEKFETMNTQVQEQAKENARLWTELQKKDE